MSRDRMPPAAVAVVLLLSFGLGALAVNVGPASRKEAARARDKATTEAAEARGPRKSRITPPQRVAPPDVPNVLVVVLDTVRADRMSLYGYDRPTTPRLDAWAAAHARVYEHAVSPGVWTLPSHASLFTALPVRTHGVDADRTQLATGFTTAAQAFWEAGYETWAFVANPYLDEATGLLEGFRKVERPWSRPWMAAAERHLRGKLLADDASTPVSPRWEADGRPSAEEPVLTKYMFKEAGPLAGEALARFLSAAARTPDKPWFAFVNLMEAHLPRIPSQAARDAILRPEEAQLALTVPQSTKVFHEWMAGVRTFTPAEIAAISAVYDASLVDVDAALMGVLDAVEAAGAADDTVIVITSDHGEHLGEDGLMLHKYSVHDALAHVPLLVSWPGRVKAERVDGPVSVSDVLPLVVSLADIPLDTPVLSALAARPAPKQPIVVAEYLAVADGSLARLQLRHPDVDLSRFQPTFQAAYRWPHKLTVGSDGSVRLSDLADDPGERVDLAPSAGELVASLQAQLAAWNAAVPEFDKARGRKAAQDDALREALETMGYVEGGR